MPLSRGISIGGSMFSPNAWETFSTTLIPSTCNGYTLAASGTGVVTVTTLAAHGLGALIGPNVIDRAGLAPVLSGAVGLQNDPAYSPSQPGGTLLGVIISGVNGGTGIINGSYIVTTVPSATSFTLQLTKAQAAQLVAFASNGTITPFIVPKAGFWLVDLHANCVFQASYAGGPPGGNGPANVVNGVSAGQTFGAITTSPIVWGSGTWSTVGLGSPRSWDATLPADGRSVQIVCNGTAETTTLSMCVG